MSVTKNANKTAPISGFRRVNSISGRDQALGFFCEQCGVNIIFLSRANTRVRVEHCTGEIAIFDGKTTALPVVSYRYHLGIGRRAVALKPGIKQAALRCFRAGLTPKSVYKMLGIDQCTAHKLSKQLKAQTAGAK